MKSLLRRIFLTPGFITIVAFLVRVGALLHAHRIIRNTVRDNLPFGYELGQVAQSIAAGHGFSSPLHWFPTGPTAWFCPIYPYLVAGIFKIFGIYSFASLVVIQTLNCAFSALTCIPIFLAAHRTFGIRVAATAAWVWCFLVAAILFPITWVWDTTLSALWMAMLLYATLKLRDSSNAKNWAGYGALWAIGALINPSLVAVLPALGIWLIVDLRRRALPWLRLAAAGALVFFVGISPWAIRNYRVFHKVILFRSNFGLELWLGNSPQTVDNDSWDMHPNDDLDQGLQFKRVGEIAYMAGKERQAIDYIRANPGHDAFLIYHRFISTWLGIWDPLQDLWSNVNFSARFLESWNLVFALLTLLGALFVCSSRNQESFPYVAVLFLYPLVFYLTHASLRYRFPMDPVMTMLAANGAISLITLASTAWRSRRIPSLASQTSPKPLNS